MSFYDHHIAGRIADALYRISAARRLRKRIVPLAEGTVIELGFRAGRNLRYYDRDRVTKLFAVSRPDAPVHRSRIGRDGEGLDVTMVSAWADALPFAAGSADSVVVSNSFCSVPNVVAAMHEARRVLKPGGRLLVAEHGRASTRWVARMQDRLNPFWRSIARGCNLNRDVSAMLRRAGFDTDTVEQVYLRGLPRALGAHHLGVARPV